MAARKHKPTTREAAAGQSRARKRAGAKTAKLAKEDARKEREEEGDDVEPERPERDEDEGERDSDGPDLDEGFIDTTAEVVDDVDALPEPKPSSGGALARVDPLALYMREVQRHPLLTPEETQALAVRYVETHDVDAAARLVTANLRLVVKIAYEYRRAYRNMMDLIQEGNIGLMQAVKRYDPYRGVKLSSYAAWWIRAYILRFILNNWRMVKIGTTQAQRKLFFNLSKEKARLTAIGIEPSHAEIAKNLNVDEQEVVEMDRRLARADASLNARVGDSEGKPTTRMDLIPAAGAGPDETAESSELSELLKMHLAEFRRTLEGKDITIFDKRLVADEPLTLQELGDEFGVSRERVRQLEARLAGRLREYLRERLGDAVGVGG
jgi:RNA polymerase sigma-32 factor